LTLTVLAAALALAGLTAGYVKHELAEPEAFADRAVDVLQSDAVRAVIAERIAVAVLERQSPDLVATRPFVLTAVEAVLDTRQFSRVIRRAAVIAHGVLLRGDRDVRVELADVREVLVPALQTASPRLARSVPTDLDPQIAEIRSSHAAIFAVRVANSAAVAAVPLGVASLLAFVVAVAFAPDRRRALGTAGLTLALTMAVGLLLLAVLREEVLRNAGQVGIVTQQDARSAAAATWEALAGDLRRWLGLVGVAGLAVWAGALLAEARPDRRAGVHRAAEVLAGGTLSTPAKVARGTGLIAIGSAILLGGDPVVWIVAVVIAGSLVLLGLTEILSVAGRRARRTGSRPGGRRRAAVIAGCAVLAAAVAAGAVVTRRGPPPPLEDAQITACNGRPELCDRRLDDVVLAGTHNSMSAADRPGWFFANQSRPIPRQLDDGIRLLMVDPHYGIVDREGRVRTDLAADGTDRNRVAAELGVDAVRAAERLAGRLDLVPAEGEQEVFLCHTLCELGAERMSSALRDVRGWLERNRSEVLVVLLESSVDPAEIEQEFEDADLEPYLHTLRRGAPLPTLREMIASRRRLVVLDERDGGEAPWFQPAFIYAQNTSIGAFTEDRASCAPGRGTPENPLLIMNHWVDRFPPPPSAAALVNGPTTLLRRARTCGEALGRPPTAIAVDFYDRGGVLAAVDELNRRPG
jgi:hypothetical protein